ncbi:hypothetical protein V1509DRAFT_622948 [Lipomyces kononenkoae]
MPPAPYSNAWAFTRTKSFSAQKVDASVPQIRLSIRKLVYRFTVLSLMLGLMQAVRSPKTKERGHETIRWARQGVFLQLNAARARLDMGDEERRVQVQREHVERFKKFRQTARLSKLELKIYSTLESMGVDMEEIDIRTMPLNSLQLAMMVVTLPDSLQQLNSIEEKDLGRFASSLPQRPVYRRFESKRLNKSLSAIINNRDDPLVLGKLSKLLMCSSIVPDQASFDIMIRGLAIKQNQGIAALMVFDSLLQSGLEASTFTLVNIVRIGVELRDPTMLRFMITLLDRAESDTSDGNIIQQHFLHLKVVEALMTACIKLNEPQLYSQFRQSFIRKNMHPSPAVLTMEIRFGYLTNNNHIATDAWKVLNHMDDSGQTKLTLKPILWMAKHAERSGNIQLMRDIARIAEAKNLLHRLKLELRHDDAQ